jgi:glucokinase-like ROK family protein
MSQTNIFSDPVFLQNGNLEKLSNLGIKKYYQKKSILKHLYQREVLSNPEICKLTNMSSPSINKLLNELITEGLVREEGVGHSIGGRRPNLFGINPEARFVVGIKIGMKSTEIAIFDLKNQVINNIQTLNRPLENNPQCVDDINNFMRTIIQNSGIDYSKVLSIGIGLPGLTNPNLGTSYSYFNYSEKSTREIFEEIFGKPVFLDNDARVMALGESAFGLAQGRNNVLCLYIGSGIGMGMILNGKLYKGNSGFAGEFGHIQIVDDGLLCFCGKRGCLETVASGVALEQMARTEIENGKTTKITAIVGDKLSDITTKIIVECAMQGDQLSIDLLAKISEYLGKGLATLIHIFNPEAIILGGKVSKAGNFIIDPIQQTLNKYTIYKIKNDCQIMTSILGDKSAVMGAMTLVMDNIFEDIPVASMQG